MAKNAGLTFTADSLSPGLRKFAPDTDLAVSKIVDLFVPRSEAFAKSNAPWKDVTGNARNTLNSQPEHVPLTRHSVIVAHGMPYGIWLEVRFNGKYAIIMPTCKTQGSELMALLRSLVSKLRYGR